MPRWLAYSIATVLLWGAWGFSSKLMVEGSSPYAGQVLFTFGLIPPVLMVLCSRRRFAGANRRRGLFWAVLTGLLGGSGNLAFYMALERGQVSAVVPTTSLFPLVTVLLAMAALGERLNKSQYGGLALALAAIYLLSV